MKRRPAITGNPSVLHYQHNGVGVILSDGMNRQGCDSMVLSTAPHPFGFKEDRLLPRRRGPFRFLSGMDWYGFREYEVFHNHDTVLPRPVRSLWDGRIVQHYHAPQVDVPVEGAAAVFTSLPGLVQQFRYAVWIPLPSRVELFRPELRLPSDMVRIGYSAQTTDPNKAPMIPQAEIESAIRDSGGRAVAAPLTGVRDVSAMTDYYAGIDIWVDRIGADFYGFSAVEIAAMGIPIVTQVGDFEREYVPECPFIAVDRSQVSDALGCLIADETARREVGDAGRAYVLDVHDSSVVALLCLEHYRRLLEG